MPVQIITHEGVALIFEIPPNGLTAKPPANITTPKASNIIKQFLYLPFSANDEYITAVTIPAMVSAGEEPSPVIQMYGRTGCNQCNQPACAAMLNSVKNTRAVINKGSFPFENKNTNDDSRYDQPMSPSMPHQ